MNYQIAAGDSEQLLAGSLGFDLTDCLVELLMDTGGFSQTLSGFIVGAPSAGNVAHQLLASETQVPGSYRCRWRVAYPSGGKQTFADFFVEIRAITTRPRIVPLCNSTLILCNSTTVLCNAA